MNFGRYSIFNLIILFVFLFNSIKKFILSSRAKSVEDSALNEPVHRVSSGIYVIFGENS